MEDKKLCPIIMAAIIASKGGYQESQDSAECCKDKCAWWSPGLKSCSQGL